MEVTQEIDRNNEAISKAFRIDSILSYVPDCQNDN